MEYDNKNSGALFTVKVKKSDKSPDLSGTVNIEGVDWDLSAWSRVSKAGAKYLSLAVKPKGKNPEVAPAAAGAALDEIPW